MNEETAIIPVGNGLVRELIEEKQSLSLAVLSSSDLRTLNALERQYWERLQREGITRQWKVSLRITFEADVNGCIQVGFGDYTANLNKLNGLVIKRGSEIVYDDREVAQERCNPGEWLNEFTFFLALETEKKRRILERQRENEAIDQIVRLKK